MNVESVRSVPGGYILNKQFFIPIDEDNQDYQDIKRWLNNGNVLDIELPIIETAEEKEAKRLEKITQRKLEKFQKIINSHRLVTANDDGTCAISEIALDMLDDNLQLKEDYSNKDCRIVPLANFPKELPEAWTDDFNTETVDIHNEKARQILLARLRKDRDSKFPPLDIASLRALEDGDKIKLEEIKKQKRELRDATEPLKKLIIKKFNSPEVLEQIKQLAKI